MASLPSLAINGATTTTTTSSLLRKLPLSPPPPLDKTIRRQRSTGEDAPAPTRPLNAKEAAVLLADGTGSYLDSSLYVPLLQHCIDARSLPDAEVLHGHVRKTGAHAEIFVSTSLVNVYMKCGAPDRARKLFDGLDQRNVVTWTALITGYVHNSQPEGAARVFVSMLELGCYPTNYTLGAVLSACCALYSVELGKQVHGYMVKYGVESDTSMGNSLCSLYSKCGRLEASVRAFRKIPSKNVISWTTIVSACGDNGDPDLGLTLFVEMLSENVQPNDFTLTSACMAQDLDLGRQVHCFCIKFGCEPNLPVKNSIMYLYLKSGEIDKARKLFDEMETVSLITWNAMIAGHAQMMNLAKDDISVCHSGTEALKIFQKLNRSGMKPDLFSFSSVLTVCSGLVALEQGEQVHAQAIKSGYLADVAVSSALVNNNNNNNNKVLSH